MKLKNLLIAGVLGLFSTTSFAQTGVQTGTPFGSGDDSIKCRQDLSLLTSYSKAGNYSDAYSSWKSAYEACPASSKNIYIFGPRILKWKISQEKDEMKRQEWIKKLMQMYDTRAKYFGDDARFSTDVIMGMKAADYMALMGQKVDYDSVYAWLSPIVEEYKENTSPQTLYYFTYASQSIARKDQKKIPAYIDDFLKADGYINSQLTAANGNEDQVKRITAFKTPMEAEFASSGLASCDMLKKVYTKEAIDKNKSNKDYLDMVTGLFQKTGCEAPAYYQASRYLFELDPTANAAMGLAGEAINNKDFVSANDWLKKAISLSKNSSDKSKCYELLAQIAQIQNNLSAARSYSNQALAENPNSGKSYIMIAQMIASAAPNLFPDDPVKQRCVYFLVLDKLSKAATVDPTVAAKARALSATYRKYLPSASEIFMHPDLSKGKSLSCGSWGTTTIR